MAPKRVPKKSSAKLSPEGLERISAAALENPELGVRRLTSMLSAEGVKATEGDVRSVFKKQNLHTRELRLKILEERHLSDGLNLSDSQQRSLHDFNPCLRERALECHQPGLLLIQDAVDIGKLKNIDRIFLHVAIDPCCCLAFAALSDSADPTAAVAVLNDQALVFYQKAGIALKTVVTGKGMVSVAGVDPEYLKFLTGHGITLTLSPADDQPKNGFIERFERLVRKDFLTNSLRSQAFQDLEGIQSAFNDWLEQYNNKTALPGYPIMGRTPLEAFRAVAAPEAAQQKSADKPALEPEPDPVSPPATVAAAPSPSRTRPPKNHEEKAGRVILGFRAINAALVCLVIYFGSLTASKLIYFQQPGEDLGPETSVQPAPAPGSEETQARTLPIEEYHVVWDRNLFGVSAPPQAAAKREKIDVGKVAVAGRDVGLKLIGTVVTSDPKLNYAIIDVSTTREQGMFREKERVGKAVIKAILRNNVIIETEDGRRQRLTLDEEVEKNPKAIETGLGIPPESAAASLNTDEIQGGSTFKVSRDEVPSSPEDIGKHIEEFYLTSQNDQKKFNGFSVGRLRASYFLFQLGVRTGDVIKSVDDYEFKSPKDLEYFFQQLSRGGDMTVLVERSGRLQKLNVLIE